MTRAPRGTGGFRWEREMLPVVRGHLEAHGYRVYANLDGRDYFDLVARRGREVGLVELKLNQGRAVFYQALRRRAWGDWTAVALASRGAARRLAVAPVGPLRRAVGVWWVGPEGVEVLRPARATGLSTSVPVLQVARVEFKSWLDRMDQGEIPAGVLWEGLHRDLRRLSQGRRFREWTLEEAAASEPPEQR